MLHHNEQYNPGGRRADRPNHNLLREWWEVVTGLGADRLTIPADGATAAVLHYAREAPGPHVWAVGMQSVTVATPTRDPSSGRYWSELPVRASAAGEIAVTIDGHTTTVQAT